MLYPNRMKKTVTQKQLEANRANSLKSTGPKTRGGKYNSARIGSWVSCLANSILLPNESRKRFYRLISTLINEFDPADSYEMGLVETMAISRWHTLRNWTLETVAVARVQRLQSDSTRSEDPPTQTVLAMAELDNPPRSLDGLSRRGTRYDLVYHRAADRLIRLREKRLLRAQNAKMQPQSHYAIENTEQSRPTEAIQRCPKATQGSPEASPNPGQTVPEPSPESHSVSVDSHQNYIPSQSEQCDTINQDKNSPISC